MYTFRHLSHPPTYILLVLEQNKKKNNINYTNLYPVSEDQRLHLAYATSLLNP